MSSATAAVMTLNGTKHEPFQMPDVKPGDLVGAPMFPSLDYFERPADLVPGQKVVIRLDPNAELPFQVFGYVAPKGQCILDFGDDCWIVPPSPTDYDFAHQGSTVLADGSLLPTANIGGGAGHAPRDMGWKMVPAYYENTSLQMASVRYGEDEFGVYAAGVAVPTLTWARALELMRSATSGDWRFVDGLNAWDFMGSCLVSLPGLPLYDGTRVVRKASASPLGENAMIVTFNGSGGATMASSNKPCSCEATHVASPETPVIDDVDARIAAALAERDAEWEARLSAALTPITDELAAHRDLVLRTLD